MIAADLATATAGRQAFERVKAFRLLREPFSVEDGTLTRTMKPRRPQIMAKYAQEVQELEMELR